MADEELFLPVEDDSINLKSITCTNIPKALLDKSTAKAHFGRYGPIHSFILRPKRLSCTVEYESTNAAHKAMADGYEFGDTVLEMNYTKKAAPRLRSDVDFIDPDVEMELRSMGATGSPHRSASGAASPSTFRSAELYKKPDQLRASMLPTKRPVGTGRGNKPSLDIGSASPRPVVDAVAKHELESILKKPAYTSEEKYRVLDARDKLIRLTTARMTDIKSVVSIRGVCPDMCPEKERLMREATHHVATFELEENSKSIMRHTYAVKQYARSSADQEFSLGHELRPEPVLQMTMNHLLHNIVDLCEHPDVNLGDWFHFLWDRTRSIRKEISQQELCSQAAVALVEQCARLHIQCAARLIAEEPQVFDQKINSENLTKCLQSLKYLYHDLQLRNEQCPNEAEFRAYVVLLNLNDCQFFWEVKQLPHHILHSSQIRFALDVYSAVESNNYVKFFKLVRQTTYMNACILLRYFTQVRMNALNILLKAYVPRGIVTMAISYWTYCLAFEDFEQTAQFFEYYGLQCDRVQDHVLLDRQAFVYPDIPFLLERAINVVEHKRECTVGEVICGKALGSFDAFEKYQPHDSFDDNGYLLPEAWTAEDQNYLRPPTPKRKVVTHHPFRDEPSPFKVPVPPPPLQLTKIQQSPKPSIFTKLQPKAAGDDQADSGHKEQPVTIQTTTSLNPALSFGASAHKTVNIFGNSTSVPEKSTGSGDNIFAHTMTGSNSQTNTTNIFGTVAFTNSKPSAITTTNFTGFSSVPSTALFAGFGRNEDDASTSPKPLAGIFNAVATVPMTKSCVPPTAISAFNAAPSKDPHLAGISPLPIDKVLPQPDAMAAEADEQLNLERKLLIEHVQRQRVAHGLADELLTEYIHDKLQAEAAAALRNHRRADRILNDLIAEAIQDEMDRLLTETIDTINANLTRKYFAIWRRAVHRIAEKRATIENTPMWLPDRRLLSVPPVSRQQRVTLDLMQRYRRGVADTIPMPHRRCEQIDVRHVVADQLRELQRRSSGSTTVTIRRSLYWKCVLCVPEPSEPHKLSNWLRNAFVRNAPAQTEVFYCEQYGGRDQNVAICMRKIVGTALLDERGRAAEAAMTGTNGVLFYISHVNDLDTDRRRLEAIFRKCDGRNVSIGIVCHGTIDEQELRDSLDLNDNELAVFIGAANESVSSLHSMTRDCLQWLTSRPPSIDTSELQMQSTTGMLLQCVGDQLWNRIERSVNANPALHQAACESPDSVISIYNNAIDRLTRLTTPDTVDYPDFPDELRRFVPKNLLDIPVGLEHFPIDWRDPKRYETLSKFFAALKLQPLSLTCRDIQSVEQLQKRLLDYAAAHMRRNSREAERAGYQMIQTVMVHLERTRSVDDDDSCTTNVLNALQNFSWTTTIQKLTLVLLTVTHEECVALPTHVIYKRSELTAFTTDAWWLHGTNSPMAGVRMRQRNDECGSTVSPSRPLVCVHADDMQTLITGSAALLVDADRKIAAYKLEAATRREVTRDLNISLGHQEHRSRLNKRFFATVQPNDDDHDGGDSVTTMKEKRPRCGAGVTTPNGGIVGKRQSDRDRFNEIFAKATACAERVERTMQTFRRFGSPGDRR